MSEALENETRRQNDEIELIASENIMSRAVREALGHEIGNKTLEGYVTLRERPATDADAAEADAIAVTDADID